MRCIEVPIAKYVISLLLLHRTHTNFSLMPTSIQWRHQGEASPPMGMDVQKLCNMCVLSLLWNYFVSHDRYIAVNVSASGGLRTLDPL